MTQLRELYRAEQMPLFQNHMFATREEALDCETGDVVLVQDAGTGLVFNHAFEPGRIVYDEHYQNEQANSPAFQSHLDSVAALITRHLKGRPLIEVGCGKGGFLNQLAKLGFPITGMDPAYEGDNPAIRKEYFSPASAITGEGVILRHVLEHIPDPLAFLREIRDANAGGGLVYIEVPCLDWILENRSWFDIFYEHVNYFRLADFRRMFGRLLEATHSFGGQYLSVLADLSTLRKPALDEPMLEFPSSFMSGISRHAERLKAGQATSTAIWGGASKGVIFAIQMKRAGAPVQKVIDINPAKQGRFLAVTGLQVLPPEAALADMPDGSDIIVMNPNYLGEIRELTAGRFQYLTTDFKE